MWKPTTQGEKAARTFIEALGEGDRALLYEDLEGRGPGCARMHNVWSLLADHLGVGAFNPCCPSDNDPIDVDPEAVYYTLQLTAFRMVDEELFGVCRD